MKWGILILMLGLEAWAEVWSANSGLSIGPSGVQVTAPNTGQLPELSYDKGVFSLNFSVLGNGGQSAPSGPVRVLPRTYAPPSNALTDSNEFFRNVGKVPPQDERSLSGRRYLQR